MTEWRLLLIMRTLVVWGAGRIGRGFTADLFHEPHWHTVFVDIDARLIRLLNERRAYTIFKAQSGGVSRTLINGGFSALHTSERAALESLFEKDSLLVDVAVPRESLEQAADMIAPLIAHRSRINPAPMDFMMNVNMTLPNAAFAMLLEQRLTGDAFIYYKNNVGISTASAMCISPFAAAPMLHSDPLALLNNGYAEMAVGRQAFRGALPDVPHIRLSDDIQAEEIRRLCTLNMAHALCCYLGVKKGYRTVIEAVTDPELRSVLKAALEEASLGLQGTYGFSAEAMAAWRGVILELLDNPYINDDLSRLGTDTRRKLSASDRLCGPALMCLSAGGQPRAIARAIRAGFDYEADDAGTRYVRSWVATHGLPSAVREICRLTPCDKLYQMILDSDE